MECTKRNLIMRVSTSYPSSSDHMCFDQLSRETNAKHSDGAKAFGPLIVVAPALPKLWLLPSLEIILFGLQIKRILYKMEGKLQAKKVNQTFVSII